MELVVLLERAVIGRRNTVFERALVRPARNRFLQPADDRRGVVARDRMAALSGEPCRVASHENPTGRNHTTCGALGQAGFFHFSLVRGRWFLWPG